MNRPSKMHNLLTTILIFIFIFIYKPSIALAGRTPSGGWKPITNVTDPTVVAIGKFAVDEHNKEDHVTLKFSKVVKGEKQLVAGMNYNLTIMAADGTADHDYVVLVWDKPWEKFRKLVSFKGPI